MARTNAAIILIGKKALLELLCFPNGIIHDIRTNPEKLNPDELEIVLEHPDLPEMEEGALLTRLNPMYIQHTKVVDGQGYFYIERIQFGREKE